MSAEAKQKLRQMIRERIKGLTADVGARLLALEDWQAAERILLFSPLPDEPRLDVWTEEAKTRCLPRYDAEREEYEAAVIANRDADLIEGKFGILEPRPDCAAMPLNQLDLVLVPGVAFTASGARLGRGRGFYDRILASVTGKKIGVAFDEQLVDEIPVEPHDQRVDAILTPTRWMT